MERKKVFRIVAILVAGLLAVTLYMYFSDETRGYKTVPTSVAITQLNEKNVSEARIDDKEQRLRLTLKKAVDGTDGETRIITEYPAGVAPELLTKLGQAGTDQYETHVTRESFLGSMLMMILPIILLVGLFVFIMSRVQGGGRGGVMGFGKSKAKQITKDMPQTTFADVAGADEAVEELNEIKDFLQHPARYQALGAKIPKGVLLYGPPGTGKTLLARAVAGEAGVPFFTISGSDFVEMFVGVGASRVRDLFDQAKQNSPCIIFVDEIDAVGRQRGAGMGGGHDEREQTLNQLLVEMDGFGDRQGIILMAATNRPDILDPALLRPGRFDRQIPVTNPDIAGRRAILEVHAKGKPMGPDADLAGLAKRTVGMSGADLANVLNEAALLTARANGNVITADALEEASDRVLGGPRRTSRIISDHEKKVTAYHEAGHTLAAWAMPGIDPVYKVTILPRGRTGGFAMIAGEDDKGMHNRSEILARIVFALGGRAAEELVFAEPTTGASSDIESATKQARAMVTEYGMSSRLGAVRYGDEQGDPFVGRSMGRTIEYSHEIAKEIDEEVRRIIEACHTEAWRILDEHRDALDALASELLEKETVRRPELERILGDVHKRGRLTFLDEFGERRPSERPPVKTPAELAKERGEEWPPRERERPGAVVLGADGRPDPDAAVLDPASGPPAAPIPGYGPFVGGLPVPPQWTPPVGYPTYGTPPPPGWSAPGWPPRDAGAPGTPGAPGGSESPGAPGGSPAGGVPGGGSPMGGAPTDGAPMGGGSAAAPVPGGLRGFRLPEHERPGPGEWRDESNDAGTRDEGEADR